MASSNRASIGIVRLRLGKLLRTAEDSDVAIVRGGSVVAYLVGAERQRALHDRLEEANDRLAPYESVMMTNDEVDELDRESRGE